MQTTKFTLELDNELIVKLDRIAESKERSRVSEIRYIIKKYLEQKEVGNGLGNSKGDIK